MAQRYQGGEPSNPAPRRPWWRSAYGMLLRGAATVVSCALPILIHMRVIFKGRRLPMLVARSVHRGFIELLWPPVPRREADRWILLVCNHSLMAEYLAEVWELVKADERLHFRLLLRSFVPDRAGARQHIMKHLPIPVIGLYAAYVARWDLIITADHVHTALIDRRDAPTLFVNHGIEGGKLFDGEQFAFGKFAYNRRGEIRYSRMFAANETNRDRATVLDPNFADVVTVVGNLHDDQMLNLVEQRDQIRRDLGIQPGDIVVFVLSTWGPDCLFRAMGDPFITEAERLLGEFRFVLSIHPLEYRPQPPGHRVWGEYLGTLAERGFIVRNPAEDWMRFMVACDVIVTDHTSLTLHGTLLGRPTVFVPLADGSLEPGSLMWRLRELSPILRADASNLRTCLDQALRDFPKEALRRLGREINSWPGESADRIRREVYALVKMPSPADDDSDTGDAADQGDARGPRPTAQT